MFIHLTHFQSIIQQFTWLSHYATPPRYFCAGEVASRIHVDDGIDTLRQYIMCTADIAPIFMKLRPDVEIGIHADFGTFHKCRDFEAFTQWLDGHTSKDIERSQHGS